MTKLGTYVVLRRVWNSIDFQGQRSRSQGLIFRRGDTPRFALPLLLLLLYNVYYRGYIAELQHYESQCDNILQEVSGALDFLNGLHHQYISVSTKTNALHEACEHLLAEQVADIFFYQYCTNAICIFKSSIGGRHGLNRMVVGFTTTYAIRAYRERCCEFEF